MQKLGSAKKISQTIALCFLIISVLFLSGCDGYKCQRFDITFEINNDMTLRTVIYYNHIESTSTTPEVRVESMKSLYAGLKEPHEVNSQFSKGLVNEMYGLQDGKIKILNKNPTFCDIEVRGNSRSLAGGILLGQDEAAGYNLAWTSDSLKVSRMPPPKNKDVVNFCSFYHITLIYSGEILTSNAKNFKLGTHRLDWDESDGWNRMIEFELKIKKDEKKDN
ncbi:MAG: hypothetical protein PHW04_05280 [Candidatus Wallbacteria bacterium]|nr:hypothetical protein [Candidatus Wallbacteria bacterium]